MVRSRSAITHSVSSVQPGRHVPPQIGDLGWPSGCCGDVGWHQNNSQPPGSIFIMPQDAHCGSGHDNHPRQLEGQ